MLPCTMAALPCMGEASGADFSGDTNRRAGGSGCHAGSGRGLACRDAAQDYCQTSIGNGPAHRHLHRRTCLSKKTTNRQCGEHWNSPRSRSPSHYFLAPVKFLSISCSVSRPEIRSGTAWSVSESERAALRGPSWGGSSSEALSLEGSGRSWRGRRSHHRLEAA